jgi:hypothetical protein
MTTRDKSIAQQVGRLKKASGFFSVLAYLVWLEFAVAVGLGATFFSDYVQHWSVFLVAFLFYAFVSACLFLAGWTLRVVVYIFDELRLVI